MYLWGQREDRLRRELWEDFQEAGADLDARSLGGLRFCWEPWGDAGRLEWDEARGVQMWLNLHALWAVYCEISPGLRPFFLSFFCRCMAEHGRLLVHGTEPRSYLHGLALLEGLRCRTETEGRRRLHLSASGERGFQKKRRWLTPLNIFCAAEAFPWTVERRGGICSPAERETLGRLETGLRALAALPEVGWYGGSFPESSLIWALGTLSRLPETERTSSPFRRGSAEDLEDLLESGGGPWRDGLALRLAALTDRPLPEPLREAAKRLQEDGVGLARACRDCGWAMLRDDLMAAERLLAPLQRAMGGTAGCAGSVHPMGSPEGWGLDFGGEEA